MKARPPVVVRLWEELQECDDFQDLLKGADVRYSLICFYYIENCSFLCRAFYLDPDADLFDSFLFSPSDVGYYMTVV